MSIINDALKKTQDVLKSRQAARNTAQEKKPQENIPSPPPQPSGETPFSHEASLPTPQEVPPSSMPVSTPRSAVSPILPQEPVKVPAAPHLNKRWIFDLAGIFIAIVVCYFVISLLAGFFQPETPRTPAQTKKSDIAISGVMTRGNKNVALINGNIYETGDAINGMTIVGISLDRVQVLQEGEIKTIKVQEN